MTPKPLLALAALVLSLQTHAAPTGERIASATKLTFGDAGTLFIADWKHARIHAVTVPVSTAKADAPAPFNLGDIQGPIASALHVPRHALRFEDMAVQPGSGLAYVAVTIQRGKAASRPAVVTVNSEGTVREIKLATAARKSIAVTDLPAADANFWRSLPQQSLTITDMKFHENKLYVAGLSNSEFASTLRVYDYLFTGKPAVTTVEMYHPVHDQIESRAPIRAMAIMTLAGAPTLVAAYTCTPLVTIPLADLKPGAHITAKTVGELGWGNAPTSLVTFSAGEESYALITNTSRAADLLPISAISDGAAQPGLNTPIKWPTEPYLGVKAIMAPLGAVMRLDNLDKELLLALRRDDASGQMQLVSIPKGAYLRISDFVNEYDFKDYRYPPNDKWSGYHKHLRTIEGFPELAH